MTETEIGRPSFKSVPFFHGKVGGKGPAPSPSGFFYTKLLYLFRRLLSNHPFLGVYDEIENFRLNFPGDHSKITDFRLY